MFNDNSFMFFFVFRVILNFMYPKSAREKTNYLVLGIKLWWCVIELFLIT